jgi:hypothetical protein|tara:strand:- start:158 stop:1309 length:1152 start_codon:yes stop_codon:yes gene_type:complete
MAESEKKTESIEEASANPNADAPKKNAVAAEPSHLSNDAEDLGAPVVKPTDSNPDGTKKVNKVSDAVSKSAQVAGEPSHLKAGYHEETDSEDEVVESKEKDVKKDVEEEEVEKEGKKHMKAGYKKSIKAGHCEETDSEIDVKEDIEALVGDADLSEEFKQKAATIFEAAINSKVKAEQERLQSEYDTKFEEEISKSKSELTEKVDSYLNYVVEEWMKENKLALERGIKGEIAEDFIGGLKKLFEDHYIDVPDEKYDVLEDQASKIEDLEKKLNEEIEKNVEMNKVNGTYKRQEIIDENSKDLADTAKEKFDSLVEGVEYSSEEDFAQKVKTIKESYFEQKAEKSASADIDDVAEGDESNADLSDAMAAYTNAISKTKDIKISK